MYIAGASTGSSTATPEPSKQAIGANGSHSWHRGNISKRFDGKEESSAASKTSAPAPVSLAAPVRMRAKQSQLDARRLPSSPIISPKTTKPRLWQPCSRPRRLIGRKPKKRCHSWCRAQRFLSYVVHIVLMNNLHFPVCLYRSCRATRIYSNPRGGGPGGRGGKPFQHHHIDRPLPPSYVCYRCGQKGL